LTAATKEIVNLLIESDWSGITELKASAVQARELRQFLHGFLLYHLGKIPKGRGP